MSSPSESGNSPKQSKEKSSFTFNTLIVMGGTTIGALVTIIASPVLTRYFSPEAFGTFAVFTSIFSLISIAACLRYELAIVLPKSEEEAINILALCLLIAAVFSILLIPIIWFFEPQILAVFNLPDLGYYIHIIPVLVFFSGVFNALFFWNTRTTQFKRLAGARITSSVVTNGYQLGSAFIGFVTAGALIIGSFLGSVISTILLSLMIWKDDKARFKSSVRWSSMAEGFRRYRNFPVYDTVSAFLNSLSWQLPVFLLAAFFSPAIVGFYSLGLRVLVFPMSLMGNSIAQNFFQKAAESKDQGTLSEIVEKVFSVLVSLGLYPIFLLTFVGANIFIVIFGPEWGQAGLYLQILSIWAFVWFVSTPLGSVFAVLEKQAYFLRFNIAILITRFGSLVIGGLLGDPLIALALFSGTGVIIYGYMNWSIMDLSGVSSHFVRKTLIDNCILFLPAAALIIFLKLMNAGDFLITVVSFLILLVYYLYLLKTNPTIKGIFNQLTGGVIRV